MKGQTTIKHLWIAALLLPSVTMPSFAHSGSLNSHGCHNNLKTGECLGSSGWLILCGDFAVLQAPNLSQRQIILVLKVRKSQTQSNSFQNSSLCGSIGVVITHCWKTSGRTQARQGNPLLASKGALYVLHVDQWGCPVTVF